MSLYKHILCFFIILCFSSSLFAAKLTWTFNKNDRIEVVKTAEIAFLTNKKLQSKYFERNIADLTCTQVKDDSYTIDGTFSVFTKQQNDSVFKLTSQKTSDFTILNSGKFQVPGKQIMPNLRHIPHFPDRDLKKGDTWSNKGEIILDTFSVPFSISMTVNYGVSEITKTEDSHTATIVYTYSIDNFLEKGSVPQDFPRRIVGKDEGIILWDIKNNKPIQFKNSYHIVFLFPAAGNTFNSYEWIMNITTDHTLYPYKEKISDQKEDLIDQLPENEGISVEDDERGLIIRLGEVLFEFDSAEINEKTEAAMKNIIRVIQNKYPDREIIVEGHTDNTGNPHYNQQLSEKRAYNIANRILTDLDHDKVSYIGQGESEPIAPNNTTEGRKKNRRVDIIIKLK